jgi:acyl transferase domain-containing protein
MMEGAKEKFFEELRKVKFQAPKMRYISNVTGTWIKAEEATDPGYWVKHMVSTVRFEDGIKEILKQDRIVFIEAGPGQVLSSLVAMHEGSKKILTAVNTMQKYDEKTSETEFISKKISELWIKGVRIDWEKYYKGQDVRRISLPTYPFERKRYWINVEEGRKNNLPQIQKSRDIQDWLYEKSWRKDNKNIKTRFNSKGSTVIIFEDKHGIGDLIKEAEEGKYKKVIKVKQGDVFNEIDEDTYEINIKEYNDYLQLLSKIKGRDIIPDKILYLWNILKTGKGEGLNDLETILEEAYFSLLNIAKGIAESEITKEKVEMYIISNNMQEVTGGENVNPGRAVLLGPVKIIPVEHENIKCISMDIDIR